MNEENFNFFFFIITFNQNYHMNSWIKKPLKIFIYK
jgi:hypothetical protein